MRLVFAGTPEAAVPSLQRLLDSPHHEVVGVLTRPDTVAGRGRKVTRSPIGLLADQHEIAVATPGKLGEATETLRAWAPDAVAVVAYGALVPVSLLELPHHGWINLHFSLLPAYRGAAPVAAAIAAGDEVTGASTFRIEEGLDTGPVFGVITETIAAADTTGAVLDRLAVHGAGLLVATLDGLADGSVTAVPQPAAGVSHAPKISSDDARIDWAAPDFAVDRRIRAVTPAPGAWTTLVTRGAERLKLGPVRLAPDAAGDSTLAPGHLIVTKRSVFVGTGSGPVELSTVQPPGKKAIAASDWARGARLDAGTVLQ